jgi:hypothetical protein
MKARSCAGGVSSTRADSRATSKGSGPDEQSQAGLVMWQWGGQKLELAETLAFP